METAIYIRTSTKEQNPENQLKGCETINSYGEAEIFKDKQSAWKDNIERVEFSRLKKLIQNNKVNHLLVWDLDRIFRNREKLIAFFELCKIYDCKIHSYRQTWLEQLNKMPKPFDDMMHNFMLQMLGWIAEEESSKRSERIKAAVRKDKKGITVAYTGNKWGRKSLSTQKQNKIIKMHKEGLSIRKISKELNLSIGVVHKYTKEIKKEKESSNSVSAIS